MQERPRLMSGMQPSGALHLGNWLGALANWVELQERYRCYLMVADWHALTSRYHETDTLPGLTQEMVADWLAAGIDPERSVVFVQSDVPEHAELYLLLGMMTPLGWLERVPSYKEKLRELESRDIHTYGFLGYPVLQSADILLYRATAVPVGQDQVPHVELTREIARRFNGLYRPVLTEPAALVTEAKVLPGLDGRKMSKSYGNTIALADSRAEVAAKVRTMVTDPARVRRSDPGHPEQCPVFSLHRLLSPRDRVARIETACREAQIGCVDCKRELAEHMNAKLDPIRARREEFLARPARIGEVLADGAERARGEARTTLEAVREGMHLSRGDGAERDGL